MKSNQRRRAGPAVLLAIAAVGSGAWAQPASDPDKRAAAVESQMTDAERFQLLHGIMPIPLPIPGAPPIPPGVKVTAGYIKGVSRLGVPDILETDASLGVANPLQLRHDDVSTAMPCGLALASTFDPQMAFHESALRESDLLAFEIAIERGQPGAVSRKRASRMRCAAFCAHSMLLRRMGRPARRQSTMPPTPPSRARRRQKGLFY